MFTVYKNPMNRLLYLLKAQDEYAIQSPFVYNLYQHVIATRLSTKHCRALQLDPHDAFQQLTYKLCNYLQPRLVIIETRTPALAQCIQTAAPTSRIATVAESRNNNIPDNSILLIAHPHASQRREQQWNQLKQCPSRTAALDLYDSGILLFRSGLCREDYLIK